MKPNLFRSIANNLFFVNDAFYKKIRKYFIGLLSLYALMGLAGRVSPDGLEITVQPNTQSILLNQPVARYQLVSLTQAAQLHISNPNLLQLTLFPDKFPLKRPVFPFNLWTIPLVEFFPTNSFGRPDVSELMYCV